MKKVIKPLGIIALAAIIGFSMAACGETPGGALLPPPSISCPCEAPGDTPPPPPPPPPSTSLGAGDIAGIITASGIFDNIPAGSAPITAEMASHADFMRYVQGILFPIAFTFIAAISDAISDLQPNCWEGYTLTSNFPLTAATATYLAGRGLGVSNVRGETAFHRTVVGSSADPVVSREGSISRDFSAYFDSTAATPAHFPVHVRPLPLLAGKVAFDYTRDFKIVSTLHFDGRSYERNQTLLDNTSIALAFVDQGIYGIITVDTTFGRKQERTLLYPATERTGTESVMSASFVINVFTPGNNTPVFARALPKEEVIALFMAFL